MQPTSCLRDSACRLRRGGGMVGWGWCSQVRASSEPQFEALWEGGGTREAGSTVAESLVVLYRVGTHQIWRRWRAARPSTSQGRAEPLCVRITGLNREISEGKADIWPRSFFFLRGPQGAANGQASWGFFKDAQGFGRLDAGLRTGSTSSRPMDLGISIFIISVQCVTLRNLDLLIKTGWSVIFPFFYWERWSWVGDNTPGRSRLLSIWSKEVWCTVLILVGAISCRAA